MAQIVDDESALVHFGGVEKSLPNWRDMAEIGEQDPDDEELDETPEDVVAVLGFDPKEIEDEQAKR